MRRVGLAFVVLFGSLVSCANAGLFKHEWTGVGSGTFGGTPFTDLPFRISYVIDSDDVFGNAFNVPNSVGVVVPRSATTIDLDHFGEFEFSLMVPWVNHDLSKMGFTDDPMGLDLYHSPVRSELATWDMKSEISIAGDFELLQWGNGKPLHDGNGYKRLAFDDATVSGTFSATAVPEPSSLVMVGLCGVLWLTFRRKYRAD